MQQSSAEKKKHIKKHSIRKLSNLWPVLLEHPLCSKKRGKCFPNMYMHQIWFVKSWGQVCTQNLGSELQPFKFLQNVCKFGVSITVENTKNKITKATWVPKIITKVHPNADFAQLGPLWGP